MQFYTALHTKKGSLASSAAHAAELTRLAPPKKNVNVV